MGIGILESSSGCVAARVTFKFNMKNNPNRGTVLSFFAVDATKPWKEMRITHASNALTNLVNRRLHEVLGDRVREVRTERSAPAAAKGLQDRLRGVEPFQLELSDPIVEFEHLGTAWHFEPSYDSQGSPVQWIAFPAPAASPALAAHITARDPSTAGTPSSRSISVSVSKPEARTRGDSIRAEEPICPHVRAILDMVPAICWIKSADHRYEFVNEECCRELGLSRADIEGRRDQDIFPDDSAELFCRTNQRVLESGQPYTAEQPVLRKDGCHILLSTQFPLGPCRGRPSRICGISFDITERKRLEEELRASEQRFRSFIDYAPAAIYIKDPKGRYELVNRQFASWYLSHGGDVTGKTAGGICPETDADRPARFHRKVLETRASVSYETESRTLDGSTCHRSVTNFPIFDADGKVALVGGFITDITESKVAQQNLRHSEERFRDFAELAAEWFWELDESLELVYTSGHTPQSQNSPTDAQVGQEAVALASRWLAESAPRHTEGGSENLESPFSIEYQSQSPDGAEIHLRATGKPIIDEEGIFRRCRGVTQDLTAQKKAESLLRDAHDVLDRRVRERTEALAAANERLRDEVRRRRCAEKTLRESENRLKTAQRIARMGDWTWNITTGEVTWSDEFFKVFELARQNATSNLDYQALIHPDDKATVDTRINAALHDNVPYRLDYRLVLPGGEVRHIHEQAEVSRDAQGSPVAMVGTVIDITEQKRATEIVERSARLASMGRLASGLAHEINNPVGGILMAAQLALISRDDADMVFTALHDIVREAKRCGRVVNNVLQFARLEPPDRQLEDINWIIREARDSLRLDGGLSHLSIETDLARDPPPLLLNRTEMHQVMANLVKNAAQAGASRVVLRTALEGEHVILEIEDNGRGIADTRKDRLFDPFYTTRHREGGTGLGLSIAHGIVTRHGGTIELKGVPTGGTKARIALPVPGLGDNNDKDRIP
ncbi:MAG: PAS domain-containing protein [Gammaproteobacteria bacterium]|nr:PAS domain-containing protein [Gammaproteobacteria bacterium]